MKSSLRTRLTLSYVLIVLILVGVISLVANTVIKNKFTNYVMHNQIKQTNEIIELIEMKYEKDKAFDLNYLSIIGMNALEKGMIIELYDKQKNIIWSAYEHNNGLCQAMISNMQANMNRYYGNWKGEFEEKSYPIEHDKKKIGTLTTGFIGPYYFNDNELIFINALNKLFVLIGSFSLIAAIGLGIIMSLRISGPLNKIAKKASLLSEGKYKERLKDESNTKEIAVLIDTINNLSDAIESKEVLRKQLTQDVAHEIRTPLTSVQGSMEAMIDGIWPMDKERLSSCYEEIIRMKRLIGSIENLSLVENENTILNKEEFDLSKLLARMIQNYEKEFMVKNLQVIYQSKRIVLYADEDKMYQVFHNLISNAIKYSEDGGKIIITTNIFHKELEISIKDTGIGIAESDLKYIFERFYRADKSRNRKTGGVGVGLTITKNIIESHGGTIKAISKLGEGTEFIIKLPNNY